MNENTKTVLEADKKARRERRPELPTRLVLPSAALGRLTEVGIYCQRSVSIEMRQKDKHAVVRGVESGGAIKEIGHYILFCDESGKSLSWLQPIQSIVANGLHAVVIAETLISVEMFRFENTYELLIVRHGTRTVDGQRVRPDRKERFRGTQGHLPLDLSGEDASMRGQIVPEFFTRGGERRELPTALMEAIRAVTAAVNTLNCRKAVFAKAPEIST